MSEEEQQIEESRLASRTIDLQSKDESAHLKNRNDQMLPLGSTALPMRFHSRSAGMQQNLDREQKKGQRAELNPIRKVAAKHHLVCASRFRHGDYGDSFRCKLSGRVCILAPIEKSPSG